MKILVIGAHGTIGNKVAAQFKLRHQVITAARGNCDETVDITSSESIQSLFEKVGKIDAIVNCAGAVKWNDLYDMTEEDYHVGLSSKLMGQVNLVRIGKNYLNENGSITLITGILADDPVYKASSAALVNGGINSFVKAAACELRNGIRINAVAPGLVEDSAGMLDLFPGHELVPMSKVVNGFVKSVEGNRTGEVIRIY
ncbi:MAG: short chain dehydrogenase [Prolixibacteraceae bacterium]